MSISQEILDQIALTQEEYELIVQRLGRAPNSLELGIFGALWSEHCGYKHSKPLLHLFPTASDAVRVRAGEENAGMVDIGDGISVVFKIESHNHPSAVEPYQGAATGVGGIIRDILAMGARPIALLNSLRFGDPADAQTRRLFEGVVAGISGYGNCVGIPDVGGEIYFAPSYGGNPLVNAMCVGVLASDGLVRARASNPGASLMLVGAATGRDGIHGASGLASRTFEEEQERRPTVQVGDPFLEKVLIEACLEVAHSGHLEGLQDLGAAGLTSSAIESAARSVMGVDIDVSLAPRREEGMTPYEVMLSESQERMLLIVKQGHESAVAQMLERWDLPVAVIGKMSVGGAARIVDGDSEVANVDVNTLIDAPQYRNDVVRPAYLERVHSLTIPNAPAREEAGRLLDEVLASPNIASRHAVYRRYDHEVQTNTVSKPGVADAAVIRLKGSVRGLAMATDGNGRFTYLEPYVGGAMAVAEACRNVAVTGARPLAVTDCLNFGDPDKQEVYYQLAECIRGMADACKALGVPVVSGNVSLYNETRGEAIYPTPIVGAVGVLEDVEHRVGAAFIEAGDALLLLGASTVSDNADALAGSEYLAYSHGIVGGRPEIDLDAEARLQSLLVALAQERLLHSAHDCSDGGLAVAIAESAILSGIGASITDEVEGRWDAVLFGERPSRAVVSVAQDAKAAVIALAEKHAVPAALLGSVGGEALTWVGLLDAPVAELAAAWEEGLERALGRTERVG